MTGLREHKASLLRVHLADELERRLREKRFEDIKVTDLCRSVSISKVTFFKYFSSKEELLRYFFRIWCLKVCVDLKKHPKRGEEGIFYLVEKTVDGLNKMPNFFHAYYSYQVGNSRLRAPFPIKKNERSLIAGDDAAEVEIFSIRQLLENFVLEAVFDKSLKITDPPKFSAFLFTYLIGFISLAGMNNEAPNVINARKDFENIMIKYK